MHGRRAKLQWMDDDQLGLDLGNAPHSEDRPLFDPIAIRADALAILAEARSADADGPWDAAELKYRRVMFPHLVSWIPDEHERAQLCLAFESEADRLEHLLAA